MAPRATKKSVDAPATPAPEPTPAPVVEEPVVDAAADEVDQYAVVVEKLTSMAAEIKTLLVTVKSLQKENAKLKKTASKGKKVRREGGARVASGFAKPTKISDALSDFFGLPRGSELARTEVTKRITAYVKEHNLQDPADKRKINPDAKLKSILEIPAGTQLSFFNLQACVKHQFVKA
jgi:chromatin remodeling complex protein RSC6